MGLDTSREENYQPFQFVPRGTTKLKIKISDGFHLVASFFRLQVEQAWFGNRGMRITGGVYPPASMVIQR